MKIEYDNLHLPRPIRKSVAANDFLFTIPSRPLPFDLEVNGEPLVWDVVINENAHEFLRRDFHELLSPDKLLSLARVSAPSEYQQFSPGVGGRTIPSMIGPIPYGEHVGGEIHIKGTLSGARFESGEHSHPQFPLGLYGQRDAQKDMDISDMLLEGGHRCALPLGYIVLNPHVYETWLADQWDNVGNKRLSHLIRSAMQDVVVVNKDIPVLYFRVVDDMERIKYGGNLGFISEGDVLGLRYKKAHIAMAFDLIQQGLSLSEERLRFRLGRIGMAYNDVHNVIAKIACRQQITSYDVESLMAYSAAILAQNAEAVDAYMRRKPIWSLENVFSDKDMTVGYMDLDFEDAAVLTITNAMYGPMYIRKIADKWATYIEKMIIPLFAHTSRDRFMHHALKKGLLDLTHAMHW